MLLRISGRWLGSRPALDSLLLVMRATKDNTERSGWAQISQVTIDVSSAEYPATFNWDAFEAGMMNLNPVPQIAIGIGQHHIMLHYMLQGEILSRLIGSEKLTIHETIRGKGVTIETLRKERDQCYRSFLLSPTEVFRLLTSYLPHSYRSHLAIELSRDRLSLLAPLNTSPPNLIFGRSQSPVATGVI